MNPQISQMTQMTVRADFTPGPAGRRELGVNCTCGWVLCFREVMRRAPGIRFTESSEVKTGLVAGDVPGQSVQSVKSVDSSSPTSTQIGTRFNAYPRAQLPE